MIEAWPWLIPAALALAAVVTAALRLSRSAREQRRDTNLALYRQRRRELAGEAEGALQEELQTELQARLLEDEAGESGVPANPTPATRMRLGTAAIFSLVATVAAVAIYAIIGEPDAPALAKAGTLLRSTDIVADDPRLAVAERTLAAHLAANPEDADAWFLLGQAQSGQGRMAEAAMAFRHASLISNHNPTLEMHWLGAAFAAGDGTLDSDARIAGQRILAAHPDHAATLEIMAVDAARRGDFNTAATYLERLASQRRDEEAAALVAEMLRQIRARQDPTRPLVQVTVEVPATQLNDPWLFIIARPPQGGPPAAVVRRPVSSATSTVEATLDDAQSMIPSAAVSKFPELAITAQITEGRTVGGTIAAQSEPTLAAPASQPKLTLRPETALGRRPSD
ncbi:MAG: c-type cytochrome biogenesis protein CcmI [Gammaproteobacteria bacterium]|nr:c-type cytochrome biogenesis protein CcmI [Gammaproteobacteria bacterium]